MRRPLSPREKPKIDPSRIRKILLIRLRRIGDVVMTTPAITALREGFPKAEITYVIDKPYRELVEGHPDLDSVIVLPRELGFKEFRKHIRQIRREVYDAVIDFHGGPRASLLTFFSRAHLKIGYRIKYKSLIYDIKLPREPEQGYFHSVENHVNLVKALGIDPPSIPRLSLPPPTETEAENIRRFIQENALENTKIITLHISAGNEFRDWGAETHFGPWKAQSTLLEKDFDCRPCRQRQCIHEDFRCLRTISPEEVYNACLPYLNSSV